MIADDVKEILISREELAEKCRELGAKISEDFRGKELVLVGILKGSVVFMTDLMKEITIPCSIEFMEVSSYGTGATSSGVVKINKDLDMDITGKHILIIEDIIDTGLTLSYLVEYLKTRKAEGIDIVCLLDKKERRTKDIPVTYVGYEVPDEFIIGYGIDYAEKYRNLPYVASLKDEVYRK
ncbi:MAG TPA: hypoxanthine phosphoribosyltransferase [Clostridiaceae bacterium]|nr:hypoxanthine phosphoribosyltransferase [Clostridiaceae bacterium]